MCVRMRRSRPGIGRCMRAVRPIRCCSGWRMVHRFPIRPVRLSLGQMLGVTWGMSANAFRGHFREADQKRGPQA
jgi:hypothetical protein